MKVNWIRNTHGRVIGCAAIAESGESAEVTTGQNGYGLYSAGRQVLATSDFNIDCCERTAKKRLRYHVAFRLGLAMANKTADDDVRKVWEGVEI